MKPDFEKLMKEHNVHGMILNNNGIINSMSICYKQGLTDGQNEVLEFLSQMSHISDNIDYIIDEFKNQNKQIVK
jgi:hypothetical protein